MEVAARLQPNVAMSPGVQAQTSNDASDQQKKAFDPQQLKDEKAALGAARELAQAQSDSEVGVTQNATGASASRVSTSSALQPRNSAEWSRTQGAPNWSTLSAAAKGYTMNERAINLYRHINAMAV